MSSTDHSRRGFRRTSYARNTRRFQAGSILSSLHNVNHFCGRTTTELFNDCGGHANPFHYHEYFTCLYNNAAASGHSSRAGVIDNAAQGAQGLYGKWEATEVLPKLDACNGHFGVTPDSDGEVVYHYHVTGEAPFAVGCLGPTNDDRPVTLAQCRAAYTSCGDGDEAEFAWVDRDGNSGVVLYDPDCPCWDANESNVGNVELDLTGVDGVVISTSPTGAVTVAPSTVPPTTAAPITSATTTTALPTASSSTSTSMTTTTTTITTSTYTTTTISTTSTSAILCTDSTTWHAAGKSKRNCAWIMKKPTNWRCNRVDASGVSGNSACPLACGACPASATAGCVDSSSWVRAGKPNHDCAWVTENPTKWRCSRTDAAGVIASTACPVACNACPTTGAAAAFSSAGTVSEDAVAGSSGIAGIAVAGTAVVAVGLVVVALYRKRGSSRAAAAKLADKFKPSTAAVDTEAFTLTADGQSVRPVSVRRENPAYRKSIDLSPV